MIVCHCHGITDREIRSSVQCGARSCEDVGEACGAGTGCGGCEALVEEIVQCERRRLSVMQGEPTRHHPSPSPVDVGAYQSA